MRAKQDDQGNSEQDPPRIEKEKLRDLTLEHEAEDVRGGAIVRTEYCNNTACTSFQNCGS